MSFQLVPGTGNTNQSEITISNVVNIVGQVADKYGFQMHVELLNKANPTGERKYLCYYVRVSTIGGRLMLYATVDNADRNLTVHVGRFHTAERDKIVEDVYSELYSRLTKELGLDIRLNGGQVHPEARAEVIIQPFRQAITGDAQIEDVRDYSLNYELHVGDTKKLSLYDVSLELASVDAKRCTVIVVDNRKANSRAVFSVKADDVIQFSTDVTNRLFVNKIGRKTVEFTLFSFPVPRNIKAE